MKTLNLEQEFDKPRHDPMANQRNRVERDYVKPKVVPKRRPYIDAETEEFLNANNVRLK